MLPSSADDSGLLSLSEVVVFPPRLVIGKEGGLTSTGVSPIEGKRDRWRPPAVPGLGERRLLMLRIPWLRPNEPCPPIGDRADLGMADSAIGVTLPFVGDLASTFSPGNTYWLVVSKLVISVRADVFAVIL